MRRYEEAVSPLTRAVELSPGTALFHYDLGLALFYLGRHEEAIREFTGIVANDPQLKRASSTLVLSSLTNLALSQDILGSPDEAANTLAPARQTAIDILYNLGRFKLLAKRAAEAVDLLQAAALLAPDSEEIIHGVGRALMDLKRESEAAPFLVRATKLNPCCTDAWYDLGVTLSRLKQRKKARSCFLKALRWTRNTHGPTTTWRASMPWNASRMPPSRILKERSPVGSGMFGIYAETLTSRVCERMPAGKQSWQESRNLRKVIDE